MRRDEITSKLSGLAFDFFYWFSRFEFALKENGYLKSHVNGAKAEPGWRDFESKWQSSYTPSTSARVLLRLAPKQQIVGTGSSLDWRDVDMSKAPTDLERVVLLLKTVRNNLFHGGKHGADMWDDPARTENLLNAGIVVLGELAQHASFSSDYERFY